MEGERERERDDIYIYISGTIKGKLPQAVQYKLAHDGMVAIKGVPTTWIVIKLPLQNHKKGITAQWSQVWRHAEIVLGFQVLYADWY